MMTTWSPEVAGKYLRGSKPLEMSAPVDSGRLKAPTTTLLLTLEGGQQRKAGWA